MLVRSATAAIAVLGLFAGAATAQDFGEKTLRLGDVPGVDNTFRLGDVPTSGFDADPSADTELIGRFCGGFRGFRGGCGFGGYRGGFCGFGGGYRGGFCGYRGGFCAPRFSYSYYQPACYSPVYYYSTPSYYYYRPAYTCPISIEIGGSSFSGFSGTSLRYSAPAPSQPMPRADDGTYPYNGGPSAPVPLPQSSPPPPPLPKDELPGGGRVVSFPSQPTRFAYPAYGEQTAPTGFATQRGLLIDTDPVRTVRK